MVAIGNGIGVSFLKGGGGGAPAPSPDFISVWDTTKAGSASDTVVLPLLSGGTYSGTIDWGDGSSDPLSYANRTHVYASSGTYTITISGSDIQGWQFINAGDKLKIIEVINWGNLTITTTAAFMGCNNLLLSNVTDAPTIATSNLTSTFYGCRSGVSIDLRQWDFSGVTSLNFFLYTGVSGAAQGCDAIFSSSNDFSNVTGLFWFARDNNLFNPTSIADISFPAVSAPNYMFQAALAFNQPITHLFTTNLTSLNFAIPSPYDQSFAGLPIINVTNGAGFHQYGSLSPSNYDATLIDWEAQLQTAYPSGVGYTAIISISFGSSQYTLGGAAEAARASLISTFGWTITDGGGV